MRRIWLFSANKIKISEFFSKQPTQLIVELNSSLRLKIVTKVPSKRDGNFILGGRFFLLHVLGTCHLLRTPELPKVKLQLFLYFENYEDIMTNVTPTI